MLEVALNINIIEKKFNRMDQSIRTSNIKRQEQEDKRKLKKLQWDICKKKRYTLFPHKFQSKYLFPNIF